MVANLAYEEMAEPKASLAQVLYIGKQAAEIGGFLTSFAGPVAAHYVREVSEAMGLARKTTFNIVIVDQRDNSLVRKLIIPLIVGMNAKVKVVVICEKEEISEYLQTYGVSRVLTSPVREQQILKLVQDGALKIKKAVQRPPPEAMPQRELSIDPFINHRPILRRVKLKPKRTIWREVAIVSVSFVVMAMALALGLGAFAPQFLPPELLQLLQKPLAQLAEAWPLIQGSFDFG